MPNADKLINMVDSGWVQERLENYIVNKDVAPLPSDGVTWECWEEFSERDVQPRNTQRTVKVEQLWSGDVIIWQPAVSADDASSEVRTGIEDDVAPMYPVNNVSDHALHLVNSVDVCVTLHDNKQPLCVDGIVSSGYWGPPKTPAVPAKEPKKGDVSPSKEENAEVLAMDAALQQSPASFTMPQEKEIKMDLRWRLPVVTSTIARAFGLRHQAGESPLWLFHASPSASYQEPLNTHTMRSEQMLKDLQRNSMYMSSSNQKKTLALHAVELPFQPGRQVFERNLCPLCVRFYNESVVEVGSAIITVQNSSTAADVLAEAQRHLQSEWNMAGPLRLLEVSECRLHRLYRPETPVSEFACFNKSNIFYHCLRVEVDDIANMSVPDLKLIEIFHCDRQSQQAFGQPLLLSVMPGEKALNIKNRCKAKLQVPEGEFKSWRLVRCRARKTHLKDEEAWDADASSDSHLCLEHVHPNPTSSLVRQSRYNKPLTIK
jgi:hypothetical protein